MLRGNQNLDLLIPNSASSPLHHYWRHLHKITKKTCKVVGWSFPTPRSTLLIILPHRLAVLSDFHPTCHLTNHMNPGEDRKSCKQTPFSIHQVASSLVNEYSLFQMSQFQFLIIFSNLQMLKFSSSQLRFFLKNSIYLTGQFSEEKHWFT